MSNELKAQTTSFTVLKKYGVPKSSAVFLINNVWAVKEEFRDLLQIYYILKWRKKHLCHTIMDGALTREGITYQVIFHRCTNSDISKLQNKEELLLSFRHLQDEYDTSPVVLIALDKSPKEGEV